MKRTALTTRLTIAAIAGLASAPAWAQTTAGGSDEWQFLVAPYIWFSGISGEVSVGNLVRVPVEKSFSDIISDFDFGVQGHFEARKRRFGFGVDVMYSNLGAGIASDAPVVGRLGLKADVRQTFAEGFGFYRAASGGRGDNPSHLDLLAGVRYMGTRVRLTAQNAQGASYDGSGSDADWVDAVVGARFRVALGSRFALLGRGDIAGFGSKLTWNLEGDLAWRASRSFVVGAGWRHLDVDYESDATPQKAFDLAYDGPRAWFAYTW
jgi:hypothetical protein